MALLFICWEEERGGSVVGGWGWAVGGVCAGVGGGAAAAGVHELAGAEASGDGGGPELLA